MLQKDQESQLPQENVMAVNIFVLQIPIVKIKVLSKILFYFLIGFSHNLESKGQVRIGRSGFGVLLILVLFQREVSVNLFLSLVLLQKQNHPCGGHCPFPVPSSLSLGCHLLKPALVSPPIQARSSLPCLILSQA